jgi:hypothetical protein
MVTHGFLRAEHRDALIVTNSIDDLIHQMKDYKNINLDKWISNENKM